MNVKITSLNNHNNSDNEKLKRCSVCLCKESKHERFSVCGDCQSVYYSDRSCKTISKLVTERKEKIYKVCVYNITLTPSERSQIFQVIGEKCPLNHDLNGKNAKALLWL